MKAIAFVGSTCEGICDAHDDPTSWTGVFTSGSGGFTIEGNPAVTVGDTGTTSCGHTFRVLSGSSILTGFGGKIIAREGDPLEVIEGGTGVITSGSSIATTT